MPEADGPAGRFHHLRAAGASVVLRQRGDALPEILHWGADLGELDERGLTELSRASRTVLGSDTLDDEPLLSLVPEASRGWFGAPGLSGHRAGRAFSTRFGVHETRFGEVAGEEWIRWLARDEHAELALELELRMHVCGLLRIRAELRNEGGDVFDLDALRLALPVPRIADEILDHTGRHLLERQEQRTPFRAGAHLRESRKARAHDGTMLLAAGVPGFGFESGEVWGIHLGWSGNTSVRAERVQPRGERVLAAGELLLPGEVRLESRAAYATPWVYASYGDGLDALAERFHRYLRERPEHPRSPRRVSLNVWEAVYFDHDLDRLRALADEAARIGVERFVLDDGWFLGRRSSAAGLGDWTVDPDVWPRGLAPLADHVSELGMEFGLWFEPEMVSPDSEVARAHPEWILQPGDGRLPATSRSQQVLDLGNPDAWDHIFDAIDRVLSSTGIAAVKWDHNRDLSEAGSPGDGRASVHRQTRAAYRLWDALRLRHPHIEFESCAGGGGRADLGIMERADRLWASDTIDALERLAIDTATSLILPPEMIGAHVGAPRTHTTGRTHDLSFRAASAVLGHFGVEWDLTRASDAEREELAEWIAYYRSSRELFHRGRVVHGDTGDEALALRGVVSPGGEEAVYRVAQLRAGLSYPMGTLRLPGLMPSARYRVTIDGPGAALGPSKPGPPPWWETGLVLPGAVLARFGVQAPPQLPEHAILIRAVAVPAAPDEP